MIRQVMFVVGLAACGPMYGPKPEKLRSPEPVAVKKDPKDPKTTAPPVPVYLDKCDMPRSADIAQRDHRAAAQRVAEGDVLHDKARALPKDSPDQAKAAAESLEKYRDAMTKDHFNAIATLMLARQYDAFHRKGCALKMLERIGEMRKNKAFQREADRVGRDVEANAKSWFATYHTEAIDAVTP